MFAITHPIKRMITSQYGFLSSMINRFPNLLDEWIHKQLEEVNNVAREEANGDYEIYSSIYNSEISRIEPCEYEEQLFNRSMLVMVYSYYESVLFRLTKESGETISRPSLIANHYGVTLDDEYMDISQFLFGTILPLRNELCHNNNGTLYAKRCKEEIETIETLARGHIIKIEDGIITDVDRNFILQTLEKEYKLLIKLAEICGYKTVFYST